MDQKWEELKKRLKVLFDLYNKGELMSIRESIDKCSMIREVLQLMNKLEEGR